MTIALATPVCAQDKSISNIQVSEANIYPKEDDIHPAQVRKQANFLLAEPAQPTIELRHSELPFNSATASPVAATLAQTPAGDSFANPASSNTWQFAVAPYFFAPFRVRADVTVAGRSGRIDLGLGSILNLDRAYTAGLRVEAQKEKLGLILDGLYIFARQGRSVGVTFPAGTLQSVGINTPVRLTTNGSLVVRQGTIDLAASYRVVDTTIGDAASTRSYPRLTVAPILGLRINSLSQKLEVDAIRVGSFPFLVPINQDFSFSRTFVEPLLGAQIGLNLSDRWTVGIRGDVSGFNISADRNFTWNFLVGTQYAFSPNTALQLGYRFNNFDFEDGSGLRRAKVNLNQNGLLLSVIFRF